MKTIMVRYKTSEARRRRERGAGARVFDELRARAPAGFRYASYRLADGVTFVHIATLETPEENPLTALAGVQGLSEAAQGALRRAAGGHRAVRRGFVRRAAS